MNDPIEVQIEALDAQIAELTERRKDLLLRVQIECRRCRSEYAISRISYIQTYWYKEPRGCTGGGSWHLGEGQFDCPNCGLRNRLVEPLVSAELVEKYNHLRSFFAEIVKERAW